MDWINSTSLEMIDQQLEYFNRRNKLNHATQIHMVKTIVGLTNVLNLAFVKDNGATITKL
jgi:hypothetical protein